jgi:hypothetical protein
MADIQRWTFDGPPAYEYADGGYVTYADHVAAVAAALAEGYASRMDEAEQDFTVGHDKGYWRGHRDAIAAAVAAVEWVWTDVLVYKPDLRLDEIVAAIKAVGK